MTREDAGELPFDHASNFPEEWWTERRKRDYYIGEDGCVHLDPWSPTSAEWKAHLVAKCREMYAKKMAEPGLSADERAVYMARLEYYEIRTLGHHSLAGPH